jgi:GTP-sensing pleiotropic transcriptional regulator CodY
MDVIPEMHVHKPFVPASVGETTTVSIYGEDLLLLRKENRQHFPQVVTVILPYLGNGCL